ncbi:MAG: hypothetical protein FD123_2624 [Bacteroidetes bacterium]|nr:MAG: hypothetical protein FD123_2624 [Bacteroidota bacterium]
MITAQPVRMTAGTPATITGVAPSSSPYSPSFPGATVAFDQSGIWAYYKCNSSAWQNLGVKPSSTLMYYADPEDMLRFPFTYNDSYTDTWSTTYSQVSYVYYRWGTTTVTADGYGTLTTPEGTFANVTRVHFYQSYKDSTNIMSTPYVITYTNDEYMWYLNGNHYPIAAVYTLTPSTGGPVQSAFYMNNVVNSVNENSAITALSLSPNPANEQVNFDITLDQEKELSIALYNSVGQKIELTATVAGRIGENKISVPVSELPAGVYFASVSLNGEQVTSRRFIVTH